jgi:hypothetical protein
MCPEGRRALTCIGSAFAASLLATPFATADLDLGPEEFVAAGGAAIQVIGWSVPSFAHWNNDGLKDLIVGEGGVSDPGMVRVYLNDGTPESPHFSGFFYAESEGTPLVLPPEG